MLRDGSSSEYLKFLALELDDSPEIANFDDSQDSYLREINQPNIDRKFDKNISTPIDTTAWYQSN